MEYVITAGIIAAVVILILICILSTWRKVPADKAAIVTGLGKAKVITGGGVIGAAAHRLCDPGEHEL